MSWPKNYPTMSKKYWGKYKKTHKSEVGGFKNTNAQNQPNK